MNKILILSIIYLLISCAAKVNLVENGKNGEGKIENNLKRGKWIFYKDGNLYSVGKYNDDRKVGRWTYYYPNGKIHQKGIFKNDKQNGIWNYYFDSGEFMGKGELINDKQVGFWKWYYKNGNLYTERFYEFGKLLEIKSCFDEKGLFLDCGKIMNGNGIMIFHDTERGSDNIQKFEFVNGEIKS